MALPRTPRRAWIDAGLRALAKAGPDAVRVEVLAKSLGVTKGGFYGYFADREALLGEMLDEWEREVAADIIAQVEAVGGDGRTKLKRLVEIIDSDSAEVPDIAMELSIRDWARRDSEVAQRLRRVDNLRMDYLRVLYANFCADDDEVEVRATISFALWIAEHLVTFDRGERSREDVDRLIQAHLLA